LPEVRSRCTSDSIPERGGRVRVLSVSVRAGKQQGYDAGTRCMREPADTPCASVRLDTRGFLRASLGGNSRRSWPA